MKYLTLDSDLFLERHWVSPRTIEDEAHTSNIYTFEDIHRKVWLLNLSMQNVVEWRLFQLWSPSLDQVRVNCIYWTVYRWSRSYSSKLLQNHTKRLTITKIFGHPHRIDYETWTFNPEDCNQNRRDVLQVYHLLPRPVESGNSSFYRHQ